MLPVLGDFCVVYFLLLVIGTKALTHMPSKLPLPMACITNSVPKDKRTGGYTFWPINCHSIA